MQKEQVELLCTFVEASRNTSTKEVFIASGPTGETTLGGVQHRGLPRGYISVYIGDVKELVDLGLLAVRYHGEHQFNFDVSTSGYEAYEEVRQGSEKPAEALEEEMRTYIESREFRSRHPGAYEKWLNAEQVLWSKQAHSRSTEIGHLCREAMQEFATELVERFKPEDVDTDKAHTVARVRAVLEQAKQSLDDKVYAFLDGLLTYWRCAHDLVQRQEHGAAKEDEKIIWEDARRVVFQTLVVMHEVDRTLSLLRH